MANSLNQVELIGNLGADPEVRSFGDGGKVANLRMAIDESYKKQDGTKVEKTEWVSISVFGDGLVGVIERYVKKGSKLYVRGGLQTRKFQDKDGNDRYVTEVVLRGLDAKLLMLDGASGGGSSERGGGGADRGGGERRSSPDRGGDRGSSGGGRGGSGGGGGRPRQVDLDDDIPFAPEFR